MKRIFLFSLFCLFVGQFTFGQSNESNTFTDLAQAKAFAKEHNTPILMVFAGSDWCKPCIQFERGILSNETFQTYAKNNLTILYLDFPLKKANKLPANQTKKNELLAEKYNPSGSFPQIILLTLEEDLISELSFSNQSAEEFIKKCQALIH